MYQRLLEALQLLDDAYTADYPKKEVVELAHLGVVSAALASIARSLNKLEGRNR